MKKQIIIIHGGDTFDTYKNWFSYLKIKKLNFERIKNPQGDWKENLAEKLSGKFELIFPQMLNTLNGKFGLKQ